MAKLAMLDKGTVFSLYPDVAFEDVFSGNSEVSST